MVCRRVPMLTASLSGPQESASAGASPMPGAKRAARSPALKTTSVERVAEDFDLHATVSYLDALVSSPPAASAPDTPSPPQTKAKTAAEEGVCAAAPEAGVCLLDSAACPPDAAASDLPPVTAMVLDVVRQGYMIAGAVAGKVLSPFLSFLSRSTFADSVPRRVTMGVAAVLSGWRRATRKAFTH